MINNIYNTLYNYMNIYIYIYIIAIAVELMKKSRYNL